MALKAKFKKAPSSLFYFALGYDSVRLMLRELKYPHFPVRPLLGVEGRSQNGMYDVTPSVIEIQGGLLVRGN